MIIIKYLLLSITLEYKAKVNNILVPNINQADFDGIRQKLAQINWEADFSGLGTFESWNLFNDRLSHIMDMHIHYRQRRNRKSKPVLLTKDSHRAIQSTAFKKVKKCTP